MKEIGAILIVAPLIIIVPVFIFCVIKKIIVEIIESVKDKDYGCTLLLVFILFSIISILLGISIFLIGNIKK